MNTTQTVIPPMDAILEADDHGMTLTALKTAMELDIFEIIGSGCHRIDEIASKARCSIHGLSVLLDALCVKGLLDKAGGSYVLTPASQTYLVRSGPGYCLPIYLAWFQAREKFKDFVRTGKATLDLTSPEAEGIWASYAAPDRVRLPELVEKVRNRWLSSGIQSRLRPGAHILDLGCGSGFKSLTLLLMDPQARVTGIDSPKVLEVTKDVAESLGVSERVTLQNGNVDSELPAETFDMVLIGSLLHYYDTAAAIAILQRMHRALRPGGLLVIYSKAVDEERKSDPALLSMIDVSNCAPFARHYTFAEYRSMLEAAGCRDVSHSEYIVISALK